MALRGSSRSECAPFFVGRGLLLHEFRHSGGAGEVRGWGKMSVRGLC